MINGEVSQRILPRKERINPAWLGRLTQAIEKRLRLRGAHTLSIAFVNHRTMRHVNRVYRGTDKITDILSFSNNSFPLPRWEGRGEGDRQSLGELLLAWPHVKIQAREMGKPLDEELAFLIIHGVLHLRGYDHETKRDAARMFPLQGQILKDFLDTH